MTLSLPQISITWYFVPSSAVAMPLAYSFRWYERAGTKEFLCTFELSLSGFQTAEDVIVFPPPPPPPKTGFR